MEEITQGTELNSALLELKLLHNTSDHTLNSPIGGQTKHNLISPRTNNFIVPPNTPVKIPMQLNPRYISKIYSSPRRMPNRVPPMRMRPYYIPSRPRTKSENADTSSSLYQETLTIVDSVNYSMMDTCDVNPAGTDVVDLAAAGTGSNDVTTIVGEKKFIKSRITNLPLKKSKSLEDIRIESLHGAASSHEMEFMSSRIHKLRVQE